jgi:hypothetical protein
MVTPMKRKALALVLLFALSLSAIARTKFVNLAKANPTVYCNMSPPVISIHSPINDTYIEDRILLNLTITKPIDWLVSMSAPGWQVSQELQEVNYQLYGKIYGSVTPKSDLSSPFNFSAYLTNLTDGAHRLVVTAYASGFEYAQWYSRPRSFQVYSSSNVTFAIDTTFPSVLVL